MAKTLAYGEGSIFLVPLEKGGYTLGVVARANSRGGTLLGYFFGPRLKEEADLRIEALDPERAIVRERFGDLGLHSGKWKVVGKVSGWNRADWPMPNFVRRDPLGRLKPRLVQYFDDDPSRIEKEYPIESDDGLT